LEIDITDDGGLPAYVAKVPLEGTLAAAFDGKKKPIIKNMVGEGCRIPEALQLGSAGLF